MTDEEREEQIQIALKHLKYKLKVRGDDPNKYNQKYLREKAEQLIDGWAKENPGELAYRKLEPK